MQKFLVVGCGGSGGSTLAYMMDQLHSELAPLGIDRIPAGWQFVHIDVPNAPDTRINGIGNVRDQGGTYIGTAPSTGSYTVLDNALSTRLRQGGALGEFGTWAPRDPASITVPIGNGAGQMRAVGRAITLQRASDVFEGLSRAFQSINTVEANTEMTRVSRILPGAGSFDPASRTVVLVVSSMAGGAGASMALDVCRLLTLVQGVDPGLVGVFMVTPDVFDGLPASARGGVRANALAMLGEIVATQTAAAEDHDVAILSALGQRVTRTSAAPFARVFPVGRFVGAEKTQFGDGSQSAVYRGLGRGLAALISSGKASGDFVEFDIVNVADPTPADLDFLGWGESANSIPWGAFGYASLSMGRDRYRHYSAQRLARTAADRLREGHLQPGSIASSVDQLRALADSQWTRVADAMGLPFSDAPGPLSTEQVLGWFTGTAFARTDADGAARRILDEQFVPYVPPPATTVALWSPTLRQFLAERKAVLGSAASEAAYRWGFQWSDHLHERILAQVAEAVELFGLPYAREVLDRVERLIQDQLLTHLQTMAGYQGGDLGQVPPAFETQLAGMRGTIANGASVVDRLVDLFRQQTTNTVYARSADVARTILQALVTDVLAPLRLALSEGIQVLENAVHAAPTAVGLANVATSDYTAWPSEEDRFVPARFDVADNEILLTPSAGFDQQYEGDLRAAVAEGTTAVMFSDARVLGARAVISGTWPVASGAEAPGGLVERLAQWRPGLFNRDPMNGAPLTPSQGRYQFAVAPADLVERALAFIRRPGESFEIFCALSLRDFAEGKDLPPSGLPGRHADLVAKFGEALSRALPLISIDSDAVNAIHGTPTQYRYKFSGVPFKDSPVVAALEQVIASRQNMADEVAQIFGRAVNAESTLTRIDIFGSYRNYAPLVFDSLLLPVAKQWAETSQQGRLTFWSNRRSRPLPASLPMGDRERRAMIAGWYVGQMTGQIRIPDAPYDTPVEIWDPEDERWMAFPHPLLTPPSEFLGRLIDWLPAVLESYLLAISRALDAPVMTSMKPYRQLRRLSDANPGGPARGLIERSSERELAGWLATGDTPSGTPSRIVGETLDARYANALAWLESIHTFTTTSFTPGAPGAAPGTYSTIATRRTASTTPIFRDLAPDIILATEELRQTLDAARTLAARPVPAAGLPRSADGAFAPAGALAAVPEPDFGAF
ncbi:tubulin-like doman-containing protein [Rathayibacter sp. AY1H3]|jgi:hypothetical protein|uniref:tubulin-like doman-containing protein n=1 Tax=Rathayibacter sp. AY1H3 TaxID=2080567 RepID=UPI000CE72A83|nr:tubulin-like doman-containing protein [Rathayibacter sp. AY1H3]PPH07748.1 hypothetical protein C5C33_07045 [Rathayibacter sp. AY1H3]